MSSAMVGESGAMKPYRRFRAYIYFSLFSGYVGRSPLVLWGRWSLVRSALASHSGFLSLVQKDEPVNNRLKCGTQGRSF